MCTIEFRVASFSGNEVRFEKHYNTHIIIYKGSFVGQNVCGMWYQSNSPSWNGEFFMKPTIPWNGFQAWTNELKYVVANLLNWWIQKLNTGAISTSFSFFTSFYSSANTLPGDTASRPKARQYVYFEMGKIPLVLTILVTDGAYSFNENKCYICMESFLTCSCLFSSRYTTRGK